MSHDLQRRNWTHFWNALARGFNPWVNRRRGRDIPGYYWSIRESAYATDVMFADETSWKAIYPSLLNHAIQNFASRDVLRFLGRGLHRGFNGELTSDLKHPPEGVRIRHWVDENSIKMYDQQGSLLRIETTINNPRRFKVRRKATRHGQLITAWFPLRQSVADIDRRVDICRAAKERSLEALGVVGEPFPTRQWLDPVSK